jgi:aspartate kinase
VIVMKFGGTSVADQAAIVRLIAIVRAARQAAAAEETQDWRGPVVVVSALGGATDQFLKAATEAGDGRVDSALEVLRALRARHLEVAGLVPDGPERDELTRTIGEQFDDLDRVVGALGVLK